MGEEWKRTYGETLLALAAANALPRAVPATTLCEEKKQLRERLMGILKHRRATALIVLLSCLLAVAVAGCAAVLGPGASGRDLPEAADYDRWIRMPQKEIFVRNWKAEYHDGAEVASVHLAPEDYEGDEYPFRGRDLPELRARVEAWAFTELPVDRENCTLYYQTEPELLMAQFAKVTAFPVDGGQPGELPLSQLDMDTYCGHVTVTDLRDGSQWVAVITDADRVITLSEPVEPLTEAQLEPILSDLREWAAVNLPEVAEPILTYSPAREEWHRMGMLTDISTCHLYDLERGEVRPVDASYPDVAELGRILLTNEAKSPGVVHTFYLTRGLWREEADPIGELRWLAEGYPDGLVSDLTWIQKEGEGLWLSVYFTENGTSYCFEYSSVNGLSGVRAQGNAREPAVPVTGLPTLMEAVAANQQTAGPDFILALSTDPDAARILMEAHSSLLAVDLSTGTLTEVEGAYTGTLEYGCISVLGAPDAPKPLYLIDGTAGKAAVPAADLTGQVAVLTEDAPLDNAFVQTVDTEGRTVVMDMAVTLKKGDLVYVEGQQGQTCTVTVLSGEPPRPRGQLDETVLATDIGSLQAANQVILKDAPRWAGTNENLSAGPAVSGVANVEERKEGWYRVTLPGGGDPFWVRREDVAFLWPFYPAGKAFVYEKEGFGSEFTISLHADGTFGYYEGMLSSHIGMGSWTVEDGVLTLREDIFQRTFRFRVQEGELRFLREGSDRFSYIKVADGDRFLENTAASAAPVS